MKEKISKANFSAFTKIAKDNKEMNIDKKIINNSLAKINEYKYIQVRLTNTDANRFKAAIVAKGFSVQSIMIEAINQWMLDNNQSPVADPGTGRSK